MTENTDTATVPPLPPPLPRPPLRRSTSDRVVSGLAGGVGRWLGIDPVIVRVVLVVLAIFGGSGLLLYAVGWLFVPEEGNDRSEADHFIARGRTPGSSTRTVLVVIGAVVAAIVLVDLLSAGPFHAAWGLGGAGSLLLLLVVGALAWWLATRDDPRPSALPPSGQAPGLAGDQAVALVADDTAALGKETGFAHGGYGTYPGYLAPPAAPLPARPPKARSYLGLATLSLALVTMGVLGSLSLTGVATIPVVVVLAGGLAVLGLGLLMGAVVGRARWLIALAVPLLLVTALVALFPSNVRLPGPVSIGDRSWSPSTVVAATAPHSLTLGNAVLDLTGLAVPTGAAATIPVSAKVGVGQLVVKVPSGMRVLITATAGTGEVRIQGLPLRSGQDVTVTAELPGIVSSTTASVTPTVVLDAQVAIGSLEVSRA